MPHFVSVSLAFVRTRIYEHGQLHCMTIQISEGNASRLCQGPDPGKTRQFSDHTSVARKDRYWYDNPCCLRRLHGVLINCLWVVTNGGSKSGP